MAVEIKVTPAGESITHATLLKWLKPDGAAVKSGEPVCELETDKATKEEYAPASGVLSIQVQPGTRVAIGAVIGSVDPSATPRAGKQESGVRPAASTVGPASRAGREEIAARLAAPTEAGRPSNSVAPPAVPSAPAAPVRLSPAARVLVESQGIDASKVTPSARGVVTKSDVLGYLESRTAPSEPAGEREETGAAIAKPQAAEEDAVRAGEVSAKPQAASVDGWQTRQRMTTIRARIAERLLAAQQNAAILTTFNEADVSRVMDLRAKYKESFQKKHGVGLGFMSFFVKACVEALKAFPVVNARIDGQDIVYQHFYHLGVAVSTEKGLMVPVLRDCDELSFAGVEKGIAELAGKAREGKLSVADLQGGTFTITNGGIFGSLLSTPILNPPQSAILGMHAIQKRPVVVDDQVVVRPMMYLALSYDHRLIDGREAVSFLVRVKECIENPERLLLEV
jgi:2-oxoglutarate dehydrogenase E2 component (dihydrolipoamide succinyltransferase)